MRFVVPTYIDHSNDLIRVLPEKWYTSYAQHYFDLLESSGQKIKLFQKKRSDQYMHRWGLQQWCRGKIKSWLHIVGFAFNWPMDGRHSTLWHSNYFKAVQGKLYLFSCAYVTIVLLTLSVCVQWGLLYLVCVVWGCVCVRLSVCYHYSATPGYKAAKQRYQRPQCYLHRHEY